MSLAEPSRTPRVLIVDDNPSIHRDFDLVFSDDLRNPSLDADELRLYGAKAPRAVPAPVYAVDHALSGLEALEKIRLALAEQHPYQLAFVDIRMPGIDGVETIHRAWCIDPLMQVVICTAYSDYSWQDLTVRLGRTDKLLVLRKPFDHIEVILLASTLVEKWFLARQAELKLEQMELLVAHRTRKLLELQLTSPANLPALKPGTPEPAPDSQEAARGQEDPPLVLLAACDLGVGRELQHTLGQAYRVIQVEDAEQGLIQARELVPDLVIADGAPPQLNPIVLCRSLKENELTSHIPCVILGDSESEDSQIQALEAGADDYVVKPFNLPLLRARVDNLLRTHRRLHEHAGPEITLHPRDIATNQVDALFLRRAQEIIEKHLSDFEFDVVSLAQKLAVSRRQLFRKLRAVTGQTPNALIRGLRLNRAALLLKQSEMTVTEITYAVGFSDLKHFRTLFREQFGVLPAEYARKS